MRVQSDRSRSSASAAQPPGEAVGDVLGGKGLPLRLGVLTERVTPELVDEVIEVTGAREARRRMLPARAVLYFVLGLALFSAADSVGPPGYRSVLRSLTTELRELRALVLPTSSALTKARQRLGAKPLQLLFERTRGVLAGAGEPGAFAFGLRLVSWDATKLDVADTAANEAAFGRPARGSYPQLQLLTLLECGTRAVLDAAFDGVARTSEHALARRVLATLDAGMLVLADRNFPGHDLWALASATGAHLAWRIKKNLIFDPVTGLADGSYLSVMPTPVEAVRRGKARHAGRELTEPLHGITVRIIAYTVTTRAADGTTRTEPFRLVTTLLDPDVAPAAELAAAYHQRWESENGYGEFKTRLRGAEVILRSKSPDLIDQELFAFLIVDQALTALRTQAARRAGVDPDRVSFTVTVRVVRERVASTAALQPVTLARAHAHTLTDLLAELLPPRRQRRYERIKKPATNHFRAKKPSHTRPPAKVTHTITVLTPTT